MLRETPDPLLFAHTKTCSGGSTSSRYPGLRGAGCLVPVVRCEQQRSRCKTLKSSKKVVDGMKVLLARCIRSRLLIKLAACASKRRVLGVGHASLLSRSCADPR